MDEKNKIFTLFNQYGDEDYIPKTAGTTYYVKNGGNDLADGLTDATAWATLVKVETFGAAPGFKPGDVICLKRGSIWSDNLYIPNSGSSAGQITYTNYGVGALPIITGRGSVPNWTVPANWTRVGVTDVYYLDWAYGTATRPRIWIDGVEVQSAPNAVSVSAALPHFYDSSPTPDRLYVYSPGGLTPPENYSTLQRSQGRNEVVYILKKNYITLKGLDIRGGTYSLYIVESSNIIVENCVIGLEAARHGIYICYYSTLHEYESKNGAIRNCIIDSGYRFNDNWVFTDPYFNLDGINIRNADNWKIHNNKIIDWNHCGLVLEAIWGVSHYKCNNIDIYDNEITAPSLNYGHGFGIYIIEGDGTGNKMYRNNIHDIPVRNQIAGSGFEFYYNIINNVRGATGAGGVAQGLNIACDGTIDVYPSKMKIYNNVIANCIDQGLRLHGYWGNVGIFIEENEIINNIIFNCDSTNNYQLWIDLDWAGGNPSGEEKILDNIYKNNLLFKTGITDVVYYRGSAMTYIQFNAENGNVHGEVISDNLTADPKFNGVADFSLQSISPAINTGLNVGLILDFIKNIVPNGVAPDRGAYEFYT